MSIFQSFMSTASVPYYRSYSRSLTSTHAIPVLTTSNNYHCCYDHYYSTRTSGRTFNVVCRTTPVLATKNNHHCYYNCYSTRTSRRTNKIFSCQNKENAEGSHSSLSSALTLSHKNPQDVITSTDRVVVNGIKTTSTTTAIMPLLKPSDGIGIVNYLRGKNYLITGATGFLGKGIYFLLPFHISLKHKAFLSLF